MDAIKNELDPVINQQSQQGRSNEEQKIIILPTNQNIKLHESKNAWRPSFKVKYIPDEFAVLEELRRRVRGILNKLTPQNFVILVAQVRDELGIDTEEKLKVVIDLIFENAINAPIFSVPFANMCKSLALVRVPQEGSGGQVQFRKLLLTKCQHEFEMGRNDEREEIMNNAIVAADPDKRRKLLMEFIELKKKIRMRQLGNIRFIGELFKLGMLIEPIIHECIKKFLSQGDEESLECLCCLLKTVGKELEEKGSKNPSDSPNPMDQYFGQMQTIVDRRLTSSRVRFMLQDVIDMKKNDWIPRREQINPKTIYQIHEEAEREALQVYQNMSYSNKRLLNHRRKFLGRNMNVSDEWTPTSKSNKGSYSKVNPSNLKLTKKLELPVSKVNPSSDISTDELRAKLKELLSENELIFNYIDANIPPDTVSEPVFIRALVQEVLRASIIETNGKKQLDQATLKKRLPLLTKFIDHNKHLELQTLYALQYLMNDLNQPQGVLRQIFDVLYDNDVITEDTFKTWEQCKDPSEQEGKGFALMSARGFFIWLREAESREDIVDE